MKFVIAMGLFWLAGGISNSFEVDAPMWVDVVDITLAYIPMALLGGKLAMKKKAA